MSDDFVEWLEEEDFGAPRDVHEQVIPCYVTLNRHVDERGTLVFAEAGDRVPFDIKRAFWIYSAPEIVRRGGHAHKECHQFIVALHGSVEIECKLNTFTLNGRYVGLYVPPGNYLELYNFAPDTTLLVLCSHKYDEGDYVRKED